MTKLLILFLTLFSTLSAEILELSSLHELRAHLKPGTLLIFDIDDTLLIPPQMLGSDVWFYHRIEQLMQEGASQEVAEERTQDEWEAIRKISAIELVEPGTEGVIEELQQEGIPIMALTNQRMFVSLRTRNQLKGLKIDLSKTAPVSQDDYFMREELSVLYKDGILFCAGACKAETLFCFFDRLGYTPARILFVDDKRRHLAAVERVATPRGIPFLGLRYSYGDARKALFKPEVADIQFHRSSFSHILSDDEAMGLNRASHE